MNIVHMNCTYVFGIPTINVHLTQAKMRQNERSWGKLSSLIVVLESLIVILLQSINYNLML